MRQNDTTKPHDQYRVHLNLVMNFLEKLDIGIDTKYAIQYIANTSKKFIIRRNWLKEQLNVGEHRLRRILREIRKVGILRSINERDESGRIIGRTWIWDFEVVMRSRFNRKRKTLLHYNTFACDQVIDDDDHFVGTFSAIKIRRSTETSVSDATTYISASLGEKFRQFTNQIYRSVTVADGNHINRQLNRFKIETETEIEF